MTFDFLFAARKHARLPARSTRRRRHTPCRQPTRCWLAMECLEDRCLLSATLRIGAMGDSLTAPYAGQFWGTAGDRNWVEQFRALRTKDITIYDQAVSGATSTSLLAGGQATAVADLAAHGAIDVAVLMIGANDEGEFLPSIFAGDPTPFVTTVVGNIETALNTVAAAGNVPLVVSSLPDIGLTPAFQAFVTSNPFLLQELTGAVQAANRQVEAFAVARHIPVVDLYGFAQAATTSPLTVGGQLITNLSAPDGFHPGTVAQGLVGNKVLEAVAVDLGPSIRRLRLTDQEILTEAGIPHDPGHSYFDVRPYVLTAPRTFHVTNLLDSGPGSLRQALLDANDYPGPDTVDFAPSLSGTISLTTGQIPITEVVAIDGPGAARLTVSGNHTSRVFLVTAGPVSVSELTIANGFVDAPDVVPGVVVGGGIANAGAGLTLTGVTFTGNVAVAPAVDSVSLGGAVANVGPTASLVVIHGTFTGNQAGGFIALGGGLGQAFGAHLSVADTRLTGNQAAGTFLGVGGVIGQDAGLSLQVDDSTFRDNRATAVLGADPVNPLSFQGAGAGGAIVSGGGSHVAIARSTFAGNNTHSGNGAGGGNGQTSGGGAIDSTALSLLGPTTFGGALAVDDSSFRDNRATGGDGGDGGPGQAGGQGGQGNGAAIQVDIGTTGVIRNSTFVGNRAHSGDGGRGGAGASGGRSDFSNGGAIAVFSAALAVENSTFQDNRATGGNGGDGGTGAKGGNGGNAAGGAIEIGTSAFAPTLPSSAEVRGSSFKGNAAVGGAGGKGGQGSTGGVGGSAQGGAIDTFLSSLAVRDSAFASNSARGGDGGGRGGRGGDALGGGLSLQGGATADNFNTTFAGNQATGGDGGSGGGQGGDGLGGGVYVDYSSGITLRHSVLTENLSRGGHGVSGGGSGRGAGGGLFVGPGGTACADIFTVIRGNHASTSDDDVFGVLCIL
jgi:lysophospholipase L1-like esterase